MSVREGINLTGVIQFSTQNVGVVVIKTLTLDTDAQLAIKHIAINALYLKL